MWKKFVLAFSVLGLAVAILAGEVQGNEPPKRQAEVEHAFARFDDETKDIPLWRDLNRWNFQAGVGWITGSTIDEIGSFQGKLAEGDAEGEIYLLQVAYNLARLEPVLFGHRLDLDLDLPLVLGVVDERGRSPFMQYNGGVVLRWKQFPWNNYLYTTMETGIGLTYSQHVLATERRQHPNRERSHLEFYWPIQMALAHPRHRDHQLVLFLHHHSGGLLFHRGGANTLGVGYRFAPGA